MTAFFILLYISYAVLLFFIHEPLYMLLLSLPVVFLYIRLPAESIRRGIIITLLFGIFIFIANQFNPEGEIILRKGFIVLASGSLKKGAERSLRLLLLVMAASVMLSRFSAEELLKAIRTLLGPLGRKKSVQGFMETGLLTLKALPGVKRELHRLYSENCRKGSPVQRMRAIILIAVALITKAINSPEEFF